VATFLADTLVARYPKALAARYATPADGADIDGTGVIEAVAARRGFRIKGGEFDLEKAAITLLNDYRSGALGRISLETPASRAARPVAASSNDALPESAEDQD
jgi:ribosome biogenesis GTPase A